MEYTLENELNRDYAIADDQDNSKNIKKNLFQNTKEKSNRDNAITKEEKENAEVLDLTGMEEDENAKRTELLSLRRSGFNTIKKLCRQTCKKADNPSLDDYARPRRLL